MNAFRTLLAAGAIVVGSSGAPALADDVKSISISYADLNVASAQGMATLRQRVKRAIKDACGDAETRDLPAMSDMATCRKTAQAGANSRLARIESSQQLAALDLTIGVIAR